MSATLESRLLLPVLLRAQYVSQKCARQAAALVMDDLSRNQLGHDYLYATFLMDFPGPQHAGPAPVIGALTLICVSI